MEPRSQSPRVIRLLWRLSEVEGVEKARELLERCMARAGLADIRTDAELLRLADQLIREGGYAAVVGRSLKVDVLLRTGK